MPTSKKPFGKFLERLPSAKKSISINSAPWSKTSKAEFPTVAGSDLPSRFTNFTLELHANIAE